MSEDGENTRYLVRGATLRCTQGSHPRKFNLPKSHGIYINDEEKAITNKYDNIGEYDGMVIDSNAENLVTQPECCNIRMFGICKSPSNPSEKDDVKFTAYDTQGKPLDLPVTGEQCYVQIDGPWEKPKEDVLVNDDKAITRDSILKCKFGGIIYVDEDGQVSE